MSATPSASSVIVCWLLFTVAGLIIGVFGIRWAVKTRQFSDPEHCARLPLEGRIPEEDEP